MDDFTSSSDLNKTTVCEVSTHNIIPNNRPVKKADVQKAVKKIWPDKKIIGHETIVGEKENKPKRGRPKKVVKDAVQE